MSEGSTDEVERMLAKRIGLDPSSVGQSLIARGIVARMAALGLRNREDYHRTLADRSDEVQALIEEVVVPESWFFRDDRPFEVLSQFAREGWLDDPGRPPLAALSIPCASGEEPYSIAITLLESRLPNDRFRVDAVDVSARSLARAIAGVYSPNAFRGMGSPARSGYFREVHGAFTVDPSLRSSVRFHQGNLLNPGLFADRPPFDVIFCRNVLIYFDDAAKARAFATLERLLVDGGLLFLGHADRIDNPREAPFTSAGEKGAFAFRKGEAPPSQAPGSAFSKVAPPRPPAPPSRPPAEIPRAVSSPAPADPRPQAPAASPASLLERASGLADQGHYDEATRLVEGVIRGGGAAAPAYFLLGLIAQAAGDRDRAEAHLLKAIYLDPQHDEAMLALALLARRKGDIAGEAGYRKRAERVRARKASP